MRPLETLLTLTCAAGLIRFASTGRADDSHWTLALQVLAVALLVVQVALEGWRWQMFPAYAAVLFIAVAPVLPGLTATARFWSCGVSLGLLAASVTGCLVLPFQSPRAPSGPYAVGVADLQSDRVVLSDGAAEDFGSRPRVRLTYPARSGDSSAHRRDCLKERLQAGLRAQPCPPYARDAALAGSSERFPVLIYFDGWPENRIQNTNLILELASRGFVVAAIDFPELPDIPMIGYRSEADFADTVRRNHERARAHAHIGAAVLDALARLDAQAGNRFAHRLAVDRAGAIGFSFGGAIAAEASRVDPRIRAVVNMDGRHWGESLQRGVERPYLFLCEELAFPTPAELNSADPATRYEARLDQTDYSNLAANLLAHGGIRVTIAGMAHMNFTDVPLRSPLRRLSGGGTIDPQRAQFLVRTYVLEFFSRYLGSSGPGAQEAPFPRFPEVRVQVWPAPRPPT